LRLGRLPSVQNNVSGIGSRTGQAKRSLVVRITAIFSLFGLKGEMVTFPSIRIHVEWLERDHHVGASSCDRRTAGNDDILLP
jgi:hypothetical protein